MRTYVAAALTLLSSCGILAGCSQHKSAATQSVAAPPTNIWKFVVAGDSRNCGDVVMPAIADGARSHNAAFYWHLGDLRKMSDMDQDFKQLATLHHQSPDLDQYRAQAWQDFISNQIQPFGSIPFFVGIGNHELVPPKTRDEFIAEFKTWLDAPEIQAQRLRDDSGDSTIRTYYHWMRDGIDFINLDNASHDQFDPDQIKWLEAVVARDQANQNIRTVVVGMHAALPESISSNHSMNEWPLGEQTGQKVYADLLNLQNSGHKQVYVLASHSHFFMDGIFNTEYWRGHGGVLPGWIIGTAGAERYPLPPGSGDARIAVTNVYGYVVATVNVSGPGAIQFEFHQIDEKDIPSGVVDKFTQPFVHECFVGNRRTEQLKSLPPKEPGL